MTNRVEDTLIKLANKWHKTVKETPVDTALERETDLIAFACLLLITEYDDILTDKINEIIIENTNAAFAHWSIKIYATYEAMVWNLCLKDTPTISKRANALALLLYTLDAPGSLSRKWAMDIGWIIRSWLDVEQAVPRLLNNVANTLGYVRDSFALAWKLCGGDERMEEYINNQTVDERYTKQFQEKIAVLRKEGFALSQEVFLTMENKCRQIIEKTFLFDENQEAGK